MNPKSNPNGFLCALFQRALPILFALASPGAFSSCLYSPNVIRIVDGREVEGRFIRPDAYAFFMEGVLAEQDGRLALAERFYLAALRRDRKGVAILVRLGAVRCAWGPGGYEAAQLSFQQAQQLNPSYASTYLERARCALIRQVPREAEQDLQKALLYAPTDIEVSLLLAEVLEQLDQGETAARVLDGLVLFDPSPRAWRALASLAQRRGDSTRMILASDRLGREQTGLEPLDAVEAAVVLGDLSEARERASMAGIEPGTLAVRAAALGQWSLAREQARLVLAAQPGHADATAVWLASPGPRHAYDSVDPDIWRRLLHELPDASHSPLSDLAALLLADALRRRMGEDIAWMWLQARGLSEDVEKDPLAKALLARIHPGGRP